MEAGRFRAQSRPTQPIRTRLSIPSPPDRGAAFLLYGGPSDATLSIHHHGIERRRGGRLPAELSRSIARPSERFDHSA
jgi:hypothetical protein